MTSPAGAFRSAVSIRDDVLSGRRSACQVIEETLARVERLEPRVDAFLAVDRAGALARAAEIDAEVAAGRAHGRLLGVPLAVKDNICVRGLPTTCASRILAGYLPPFTAHAVERVLAEGGIVIGKTNCDEFGMGSSTENSAYKPTRNPYDTARVPGGSSGGSAAAVAAGMVPLSLGSDTGGSIRQPASLCGVVGFKPTYGAVSRFGLVAFASSLDQIGPIGASLLDVATLASVISGPDARDSTSLPREAPDCVASLSPGLEGVRIGVHRDYFEEIADAAVRALIERALETLREAGARIVRIDRVDLLSRCAVPAYYLVANSEASSNLARFDGFRYGPSAPAADLLGAYTATRGRLFGDEVKRRILLGTFALSSGYHDAYYLKALRVRRLFIDAFREAFRAVDFIAGATSPIPAFALGEKIEDPVTMYQCDVFTIPASLAGLPALSVPCGRTPEGLPVGLQIIGPPLADTRVLSCAFAFEQRSGLLGALAPMAEEPA
ncbi:MAG: Asp-tRNA(Asn)/Glu-tRNA(Gln) amidotransferase subunit GatA [Planctomycetes bacterium]|nr:Asp-tRNA(Asn)/Glu-tRNA(Gln) amidotransferase subunit GatA [Planctomycetota bacterium]